MNERSFWFGALSAMALMIAIGAGFLMAGRGAAASVVERFGDAVSGAFVAPVTGRAPAQEVDAAAAAAAAAAVADVDDTVVEAEIAADPCAGRHPFGKFKEHGEMFGQSGPAVVVSVEAGSAASVAGLAEGDQITSVDGESVADVHALVQALGARSPGETVALVVERDGETLEIEATLGVHPEDDSKGFLGIGVAPTFRMEIEGMPGEGGMMMPFEWPGDGAEMDEESGLPLPRLRMMPRIGPGEWDALEGFSVDGVLSGALVSQVVLDGPAQAAGLQERDLITAIDGEPIDNADALVAAIGEREAGVLQFRWAPREPQSPAREGGGRL